MGRDRRWTPVLPDVRARHGKQFLRHNGYFPSASLHTKQTVRLSKIENLIDTDGS